MDDLVLKKIVLEVINQLNKTCIDSVFVLSDNNSFCFKNELENMGYKVDISNNACDFNNHCMFIIDDLSVDIISSISNLLYKDSNTSFIINALLSGKKVLALKDNDKFDNYKKTASNQLFSKLLELENTAKSYGLIILDSKSFLSYFSKNSNNEIKSSSASFDFTDKKVITKSDIMDIVKDYSSIIVRNNVIITPLVMDYIKENKIDIIYNE